MPHQGQTGVYFESHGRRLLGTLFLAQDDSPKPTALILHGIPGIEKNYDIALMLRKNGWNSLIFHYQGCWGSQGIYTLKTIPDDVCAALDYLSQGQHPQINPHQLVCIGHSLGGWAAVLSAVQEARVKAVAVYGIVADPTSLPFSAADALANFTPWLPGLTPDAFVEQWQALDTAYSPLEQVSALTQPLLVLHGQADEVIPIAQAEALFARAQGLKQIKIHPDANHAFAWHRDWLLQEILQWLKALEFRQ